MKENIGLVHCKEIENFFARIGLSDKLNQGELKCHSCGDPITLDNFRAVFKEDGHMFFLCNKVNCFKLESNEMSD